MANATGLTGRTSALIEISALKAFDLNDALDTLAINSGINWTFGTGVNQANLLYHAQLTATNAQAVVDISGTDIQDVFGDDCDFAALKLMYIKNTDETEDLKLGGDANAVPILADKTSDILLLPPGGIFLFIDPSAAGLDVTANKNLKIQAETAHVTYDIVLMGEAT